MNFTYYLVSKARNGQTNKLLKCHLNRFNLDEIPKSITGIEDER